MTKNALAKWIYEQRYLHRTIRVFLAKIIAPGFREGHTFRTDFFGMEWSGKTNNYLDYQVLLRGAYEKFMLFFMESQRSRLPLTRITIKTVRLTTTPCQIAT